MEQVFEIGVKFEDGVQLERTILEVAGCAHGRGSEYFSRSWRSVYTEPGERRSWKYCWQDPDLSILNEVLDKMELRDMVFEVLHNGEMLVSHHRWEACRDSYKHVEQDGTRRILPMDPTGATELTVVKIRGE